MIKSIFSLKKRKLFSLCSQREKYSFFVTKLDKMLQNIDCME